MLLHMEDAAKEGYTKVVVCTVVEQHNTSTSRYFAAHEMAGPDRCTALQMCCMTALAASNQGRKQLFTQKGRAIDGLPPHSSTNTAHKEGCLPRLHGHCWGQMMVAAPEGVEEEGHTRIGS